MIAIAKVKSPDELAELKRDALSSTTSPLDGMWEAFVSESQHWQVRIDERGAGYFCINREGQLLQFHLGAIFANRATEVFSRVLAEQKISTAIVSTAEPAYLSLCLDAHQRVRVHSLLYRDRQQAEPAPPRGLGGASFDQVAVDELPAIEAMHRASLDADPGTWLTGYLNGLAVRSELFALRLGGELLGTGECRVSQTQPPYADLGVIVSRPHRGKGLGSHILWRLKAYCYRHHLEPICSTAVENTPAQKVITKAGFVSRHRILEITF